MLLIALQPEWYFTQVLTWIRDHREFLNERIQPELEKAELGHVNALVGNLLCILRIGRLIWSAVQHKMCVVLVAVKS